MNKNTVVAVLVALVVIAGVAVFYVSGRRASSSRDSLAAGYEAQALASPLTLTSKSWDAASGTWTYNYTSTDTPSDAISAVKLQLAASKGYQVVATKPDVEKTSSATLYRDLITEDVALKIQIGANPSSTGPPSIVMVTVSPLQGN